MYYYFIDRCLLVASIIIIIIIIAIMTVTVISGGVALCQEKLKKSKFVVFSNQGMLFSSMLLSF